MDFFPKTYATVNIIEDWKFATKFRSLSDVISKPLPLFLLVAGIIFFFLFIFAGFSFLTSAGSDDAQAKEKWKQILTYGAIGLIIIFGAFWILQIVNFITGGILDKLL